MRLAATLGAVTLLAASALAGGVAAQNNVRAPWTNPEGEPWTNEAGECWRNPGAGSGPVEACGDPMPEPEPEPEPGPRAETDASDREPETVTRVQELELDSRVLFGFGAATLTDAGRVAIDEVLTEVSDDWQLRRVRIIGHTDRIGSAEANHSLSERRAQAVATYLRSRPETANVEIDAMGRGESDPVVTCGDGLARAALIECLAPNRRVALELGLEREVERRMSQ